MGAYSLSHLSDRTLLHELAALVARDRVTTAELLAHIAEVEERELYLPGGCNSMFDYCVRELRMSEDMAFKRIRAARVALRFPVLFDVLADGRLHLTGVVLLAPNLTTENAEELIAAATGKTKKQIEHLIADRFPRADLPTMVRALPARQPTTAPEMQANPAADEHTISATSTATMIAASSDQVVPEPPLFHPTQQTQVPGASEGDASTVMEPAPRGESVTPVLVPAGDQPLAPAKVAPIAPKRYGTQFTMSQEMHDDLRLAQELLSHQIPSGNVVEVFHYALKSAIREQQKRKYAVTTKPRGSWLPTENPRYIPAAVRRAVYQRDQGRCAFVSESGRRCSARSFLELDHVEPVARGGVASVSGTRLLCRAHNQFEAERAFGKEFMNRKREQARLASAESRARRATPEACGHG